MSPVPILMLGADYSQAFAPALGESLSLSSSEIGTRNMTEMTTRVSYYTGLGYDKATALAAAIRDYDKDHSATATPAQSPVTTTGKKYDDILASILPFVKTGLENAPALIAAIRNKNPGMSEAEAAKIAQYGQQKSLLASSMPWLVIGGVGLVAVLLLVGTRKR